MQIIKRDGTIQEYDSSKIKERLYGLCNLNLDIDSLIKIFEEKTSGVSRMSTYEIDKIISGITESKSITNSDYSKLSLILLRDNLIKSLKVILSSPESDYYDLFLDVANRLGYSVKNKIVEWKEEISSAFHKYKNVMDYTGYRFMMKYCRKVKEFDVPLEIPEFIFMRVSLAIFDDVKKSIKLYKYLCLNRLILGSSILFNAGWNEKKQQLSNCFVVKVEDDNYHQNKTIFKTGLISASGGGLGVSVSGIREKGAYINGGGKASGALVFLRTLNESLKMNSQKGLRPGNSAANIELWHPEVVDVINDRDPRTGKLQNVFPSMWISDHFMRYVKYNKQWKFLKVVPSSHLTQLFDRKFSEEMPNLPDDDFKFSTEYERLASNPDNVFGTINAVDLYKIIIKSIGNNSVPYTLSKDECNRCNMQDNLGVVEGSNLCAEIIQYHDKHNTSVCNIGSIVLPNCVELRSNGMHGGLNWELVRKTQRLLVDALDACIDKTVYPSKSAERMNKSTRPISCGIQGLADLFIICGYAFDSDEACDLNEEVAEKLQYYALERSCELAEIYGAYNTFEGSSYDKGIFHHERSESTSDLVMDWDSLRQKIKQHKLRNSLLSARMPTVSTSSITGASPGAEPYSI